MAFHIHDLICFRKVKEKPKEVSAAGETPDLVRDCNEVALAEEILAE